MNRKPNFFYYLFKLMISLAGLILGIVVGVLFFYPLMLAFSTSTFVVFIELYIIIFLALCGVKLFNGLFMNYIQYKALFTEISLKSFLSSKMLILSFYIFGLIFFLFFILSF